jgi:tyrosinase
VATHINQTNSIHNTANFLSWHRYYVWTYERALREECGYSGFQPYWNWDRYAADPANSPLFNGNASSMSGNSKNGGCVTSGPFAKSVELSLVFFVSFIVRLCPSS